MSRCPRTDGSSRRVESFPKSESGSEVVLVGDEKRDRADERELKFGESGGQFCFRSLEREWNSQR